MLRVALTRCESVLGALQADFKSKLRRSAAEAVKVSKETAGASSNLANLLNSIMKHVGENMKRVLEGLLVSLAFLS